jgi:hypothetical protein
MEDLMYKFKLYRRSLVLFLLSVLSLSTATQLFAQQASRPENPLYEKLKKFELRGKASASGLTLKRDRATMTFTGDFYFAAPVNEKITGAVFIGSGTFHAEAPDRPFEKEYMKRFINTDVADSDFKTAVLRFNDDTVKIVGQGMDVNAAASSDAQKLASELDARLLKETGANVSARLLVALANKEEEGLFVGQFDKGKLGRFTYMYDPQARLLGSAFEINGGEKVLLFQYSSTDYTNDLLVTSYSEKDIANNAVAYSSKFDLVSPYKYTMEIDLRDPRKVLSTKIHIDFESITEGANLTAIPMNVNQGLSERNNDRLKYAMRIKSAKVEGKDIPFVQEDWETGLTIILPKSVKMGDSFTVDLDLEGEYISKQRTFENNYFPTSNEAWFPMHGYNRRSKYDITFRHNKTDLVTSVGTLVRVNEPWPDAKDGSLLTQFIMETPITFATFAAGRLERYTEKFKVGAKGKEIEMPIDLYSVPSSVAAIKEKFVAAELGNSLNFFTSYFGPYTFGDFRATVHPFNSGQGFPTMVLLPAAKGMDEANRDVFSLIARETSHQWWGGIVTWRSYRDQWLSDGFAQYAGMMYTGFIQNPKSEKELIKTARFNMEQFATGTKGNMGKVAVSGPMIFGSRLGTRLTTNAYNTLINNKGALVMRMLHFLFSDTSVKGKPDQAFVDMLADFVNRFNGQAASTEDFIQVSGEHFARTSMAKRLGLQNLDWFFQQWVFDAKYPSYRLEYSVIDEGGKTFLAGNVIQENAGPNWIMPLPVILKISGQQGQVMVLAKGPDNPFKISLPAKPESVELDPDLWILSEKTITKKK